MDGLRRAALALSALDVRDREWVLDQLPLADRRRVRLLLDELHALGMVVEPDVHARLRDEEARRRATALAAGDEHAEQAILRLDDCSAEVVVQVFNDEPDVVVAALLTRFPWRWAGEALGRLHEVRRSRIARMKHVVCSMQEAPWRALVQSMSQRINACHEEIGGRV